MNNPQDRFICTREEIEKYGDQRERFGTATFGSADPLLFESEAAVFKRPVPEWATHFYRGDLNEDHDLVRKFEEIPK